MSCIRGNPAQAIPLLSPRKIPRGGDPGSETLTHSRAFYPAITRACYQNCCNIIQCIYHFLASFYFPPARLVGGFPTGMIGYRPAGLCTNGVHGIIHWNGAGIRCTKLVRAWHGGQ